MGKSVGEQARVTSETYETTTREGVEGAWFAWMVDAVNWFLVLFLGTAIFKRIRRFRTKLTSDVPVSFLQ